MKNGKMKMIETRYRACEFGIGNAECGMRKWGKANRRTVEFRMSNVEGWFRYALSIILKHHVVGAAVYPRPTGLNVR
jgi:hypothetical protein